jgi:GNAT superfamily N-acetyltransferase
MIRVVRDHTPENCDPLTVRAGDRLHVGHADDEYPGWRWCTGPDGRAGWVPERCLRRDGKRGVMLRDYTARELSVRAGTEVEPGEAIAGWVWVTSAEGRSGWIPETPLPRLRQAGSGDAGAVAALHIASWQATYRGELPDSFLDRQSLAERASEWERRLAEPGSRLLLVEGNGMLLGFAAYGPSRDIDADPARIWELYNLHLLPEQRGGGLGHLLFDAVAEQGRHAGRGRLSLWVGERNWPARRFYERRGMQADGTTQMHRLGSGAELAEVRYVRSLD